MIPLIRFVLIIVASNSYAPILTHSSGLKLSMTLTLNLSSPAQQKSRSQISLPPTLAPDPISNYLKKQEQFQIWL